MNQSSQDTSRTVSDYYSILSRRRWLFWGPLCLIMLAVLVIASTTPPVYRSLARIMIEDEEISERLVGAADSGFASQQIRQISERVLTVESIRQIVAELDVYDGTPQELELSDAAVASMFRGDVSLDVVSTSVIDPRSRRDEAAIAFAIGFESSDPEMAQRVTARLAELFLDAYMDKRRSRSTEMSKFLTGLVGRADEELIVLEAELADFKEANEGALPDQYQVNLSIVDRAEQEMSDVRQRMQQLEQRIIELSGQLSSLDKSQAGSGPTGAGGVLDDRSQLRALMAEYRQKSAIYKAGHPDLVRLEREIESLRAEVGDINAYEELEEQLRSERAALSDLRRRYGEQHPDVVRTMATIEELERELAEMEPPSSLNSGVVDNPAYLMIDTQIKAARAELRSAVVKQAELRDKIAEHQEYIRRAPEVEMQYDALMRRYEESRVNVIELQSRLREADVAGEVAEELSEDRFTLIEPPLLPTEPVSPNRSAIVLLGLIFGLGVSGGLVSVAELFDDTIHGVRALAVAAGAPPLVVIPVLNKKATVPKSS